jgi:acylphosphatase
VTGSAVKRLVIHGRVQGVGYRYSMLAQASRIGVTGWVRNRHDGTVEAVIAGPAALLDDMIAWARQGPPGSKVTDIVVEDTKGAFQGFEILPTE